MINWVIDWFQFESTSIDSCIESRLWISKWIVTFYWFQWWWWWLTSHRWWWWEISDRWRRSSWRWRTRWWWRWWSWWSTWWWWWWWTIGRWWFWWRRWHIRSTRARWWRSRPTRIRFTDRRRWRRGSIWVQMRRLNKYWLIKNPDIFSTENHKINVPL